jgi:hypothetical protein
VKIRGQVFQKYQLEIMMKIIDLKKELKHLYNPSAKEVVAVEVPDMNFLMIDGQGDPNTSQSYAEAIEALYAVSYNLKFMIKKGPLQIDYGVMPLEGLWWADDMSTFSTDDKSNWKWTMMIMHIGPFSEEGPTVEKVHQYIDEQGDRRGKHHEIYLSDIRKADPAEWRTVIRQPMY